MKNLLACLVILAAMVLPLACLGQQDDKLPMGKLGKELGAYLTIEGTGYHERKAGNLLVDTVDGKKLEPPIAIMVENLADLAAGVRCVIRGYESGKMIGVPDEAARKENLPVPQAAWQFYRYFVATSVVSPADLKLKR